MQNRSALDSLTQLALAGLSAGAGAMAQAMALNSRYLRLIGGTALFSAASGRQDIWQKLATEYRNYGLQLAAIPVTGAQYFAAKLAGAGAKPGPDYYLIDGKPLALPARVARASQGMLFYSVAAASARPYLPEAFALWPLSSGRALFALFIVDYQASDLGRYFELGAAFCATVKGDPIAMPGMYLHTMLANDAFSVAAGRTVWGFNKYQKNIQFLCKPGRVQCIVDQTLSLTMPTGGDAASSGMPFYNFTLLNGQPNYTLFLRNAQGEQVRSGGGGTELLIADNDHPLCAMLRAIGLPKTPMLQVWSEKMSGAFSVPYAFALPAS